MVAVGLAIEMLSHPARYVWMELEADDVGALDDVVLLGNDGRLLLRQVKFSTDPDGEGDPWTWEDLLLQKTPKSNSLLQKWSRGIQKALGKAAGFGAEEIDAAVVTNRRLDHEIASCLRAGYLEFEKLDEEIVRRATEQVSRAEFEEFCSRLRWDTDRPNYDTLDKMHQRLFSELGGTNEGWLSLCSSIRDWVREREEPPPGGRITVQHLRRAALWCPLEPLPQNFEVPRDFVLPSEAFHDDLMSRILDTSTNFLVVTGSPGVGKSTCLSYLTGVLQGKKMPVVRHHYWLSAEEDRRNRLEFEAVARSLMADLEKHFPEAVQAQSGQNPQPGKLRDWLETAATHFENKGARLVIIIDGLDHVWREMEHSAEELAKLLDHVLISHPGLVVVFGTQELASSVLTPKFFRHAPREEWLELPYLDTAAITRLLSHHAEELDLPGEEQARGYVLRQLTPAFLDRSSGHPLHLRYCLEALKEEGRWITTEAVYALPDCPHKDIREYYRNLLDALEDEAALALQLIVEAPFPMAENEIGDCLVAAGSVLSAAQRGFRSIRHLLRGTGVGWTPFHGSVRQFVAEDSKFEMHQSRLRRVLLDWLSGQGGDERRWSHEWLLKAQWTGDELPLRDGPNREWAVRSIIEGRPLDQAQIILRESALAALRSKDIEGFVRTTLLAHYVSIPAGFYHFERHRFMMPRLRLERNSTLFDILLSRMDELNPEELLELIRYDHSFCQGTHAPRIFERMSMLCDELRDADVIRDIEGWREGVGSLLNASAYVEEGSQLVLELLNDECRKPPTAILARACKELVRSCNVKGLRYLADNCPPQNRPLLVRYLVLQALEDGVNLDVVFSDDGDGGTAFFRIYRHLKGRNPGKALIVFPSQEYLEKDSSLLMNNEETTVEWFAGFFWTCVACGIESHTALVRERLGTVLAPPWTKAFLGCLAVAGNAAGRAISSRERMPLDAFYDNFAALLQRSALPYDTDGRFSAAAPRVLARLSIDLVRVQRAYIRACSIAAAELQKAVQIPLFDPKVWIEEYLGAGREFWERMRRTGCWRIRKKAKTVTLTIASNGWPHTHGWQGLRPCTDAWRKQSDSWRRPARTCFHTFGERMTSFSTS